ncbi:MAG: CpaF family protein [Alphaproteobacteria bacterium]|nr:MAG: CpaF family protein [Alphaproteobacteria bacterium]
MAPLLKKRFTGDEIRVKSRSELASEIENLIIEKTRETGIELSGLERRDLLTVLLNEVLAGNSSEDVAEKNKAARDTKKGDAKETVSLAKERLQPLLMEHIDASAASEMERGELSEQISEVVSELMVQEKINLNLKEQRQLVTMLLNDMLGLGPLEPLLADESITDIMVNGPKQVYVERNGKLELTDVQFRDQAHLMNICTRIVTAIGRRVDESTPLCDARLADGSRVNIIIPPLAIDGASISIRKFSKKKITLDRMIETQNLSPEMATVLKIAAASRLNILISGGTGSGKTTMLNALSRLIDPGERVVTIEDAAELQLQQPHVVRLETRPPNLEGQGEITMRDLVKNSLRMRPDRIILGEVRGAEALDVLQAMNTGHDGSMCTLHANRPREALTRLENMVNMGSSNLPSKAIRTQIASAVDLIVQVARMRDGVRRVQAITEVVGMEGDVITTQDLFVYEFEGEDETGKLRGNFRSTGVRPHFTPKAEYFGLHRALLEAM